MRKINSSSPITFDDNVKTNLVSFLLLTLIYEPYSGCGWGRMGGGKKTPPISFSPVTSKKVGINILVLTLLPHWLKFQVCT